MLRMSSRANNSKQPACTPASKVVIVPPASIASTWNAAKPPAKSTLPSASALGTIGGARDVDKADFGEALGAEQLVGDV